VNGLGTRRTSEVVKHAVRADLNSKVMLAERLMAAKSIASRTAIRSNSSPSSGLLYGSEAIGDGVWLLAAGCDNGDNGDNSDKQDETVCTEYRVWQRKKEVRLTSYDMHKAEIMPLLRTITMRLRAADQTGARCLTRGRNLLPCCTMVNAHKAGQLLERPAGVVLLGRGVWLFACVDECGRGSTSRMILLESTGGLAVSLTE
jgi:hypothetical protein